MTNRSIETHKVNGLNEALEINVLDEPGQGNACHKYRIIGGRTPDGDFRDYQVIKFQNGPISEVGVNGVSNEALLAIVRDRLEGFQSGPYACESNQLALDCVISAMAALHSRTKERMERGVEGTHEI